VCTSVHPLLCEKTKRGTWLPKERAGSASLTVVPFLRSAHNPHEETSPKDECPTEDFSQLPSDFQLFRRR
jgi:hypothetical protein